MVKKKGVSNADIGARIQAARVKAGQTQVQLGEKIGVSFQSISQYETGTTTVNALQLIQIADALGCKTTDLIP